MNVDRTAATILLHQFSEWLDTYPAEIEQTHDDLVRIFLDERSPAATPTIGPPDENMVEIGGERMTERQFDAARYPLLHPTSDLDGATDPGSPATMPATPGEFAARWNSKTEEQRAAFLQAMQEASDRAQLCYLQHDGVRWVPTYSE